MGSTSEDQAKCCNETLQSDAYSFVEKLHVLTSSKSKNERKQIWGQAIQSSYASIDEKTSKSIVKRWMKNRSLDGLHLTFNACLLEIFDSFLFATNQVRGPSVTWDVWANLNAKFMFNVEYELFDEVLADLQHRNWMDIYRLVNVARDIIADFEKPWETKCEARAWLSSFVKMVNHKLSPNEVLKMISEQANADNRAGKAKAAFVIIVFCQYGSIMTEFYRRNYCVVDEFAGHNLDADKTLAKAFTEVSVCNEATRLVELRNFIFTEAKHKPFSIRCHLNLCRLLVKLGDFARAELFAARAFILSTLRPVTNDLPLLYECAHEFFACLLRKPRTACLIPAVNVALEWHVRETDRPELSESLRTLLEKQRGVLQSLKTSLEADLDEDSEPPKAMQCLSDFLTWPDKSADSKEDGSAQTADAKKNETDDSTVTLNGAEDSPVVEASPSNQQLDSSAATVDDLVNLMHSPHDNNMGQPVQANTVALPPFMQEIMKLESCFADMLKNTVDPSGDIPAGGGGQDSVIESSVDCVANKENIPNVPGRVTKEIGHDIRTKPGPCEGGDKVETGTAKSVLSSVKRKSKHPKKLNKDLDRLSENGPLQMQLDSSDDAGQTSPISIKCAPEVQLSPETLVRRSFGTTLTECFRKGFDSMTARMFDDAIKCYSDSIDSLLHWVQEHPEEDDEFVELLPLAYYAYAVVISESASPSVDCLNGVKQQLTVELEQPTTSSNVSALIRLGAAKICFKLCDFDMALTHLTQATTLADSVADLPSRCWPGTKAVILESEREGLKAKIAELKQCCENPPKAVANCCFGDIGYRRAKMYANDPDFDGFARLSCCAKCKVEMHKRCFDSYKAEERITDAKEILNFPCWTPGCDAMVEIVETFRDDMIRSCFHVVDKGSKKRVDARQPSMCSERSGPSEARISSSASFDRPSSTVSVSSLDLESPRPKRKPDVDVLELSELNANLERNLHTLREKEETVKAQRDKMQSDVEDKKAETRTVQTLVEQLKTQLKTEKDLKEELKRAKRKAEELDSDLKECNKGCKELKSLLDKENSGRLEAADRTETLKKLLDESKSAAKKQRVRAQEGAIGLLKLKRDFAEELLITAQEAARKHIEFTNRRLKWFSENNLSQYVSACHQHISAWKRFLDEVNNTWTRFSQEIDDQIQAVGSGSSYETLLPVRLARFPPEPAELQVPTHFDLLPNMIKIVAHAPTTTSNSVASSIPDVPPGFSAIVPSFAPFSRLNPDAAPFTAKASRISPAITHGNAAPLESLPFAPFFSKVPSLQDLSEKPLAKAAVQSAPQDAASSKAPAHIDEEMVESIIASYRQNGESLFASHDGAMASLAASSAAAAVATIAQCNQTPSPSTISSQADDESKRRKLALLITSVDAYAREHRGRAYTETEIRSGLARFQKSEGFAGKSCNVIVTRTIAHLEALFPSDG